MTRANGSLKQVAPTGMAGLEETLAPLALAYPETGLRPNLWQRIEAAVDAVDRPGRATSPPKVVRREEGWRQYARDVQIKRLWDANTFLLRCAPGGVLPPHEHKSFEHCVVIEGDMIVGGETYRSGDYHGVPANVGHK